MGTKQPAKLDERVAAAADAVLRAGGSVGLLELLLEMRLLAPSHITRWKIGTSDDLSGSIQGRSAAARNLEPEALALAVKARVRHNPAEYEDLLMQGSERYDARRKVGINILEVLANCSGSRP